MGAIEGHLLCKDPSRRHRRDDLHPAAAFGQARSQFHAFKVCNSHAGAARALRASSQTSPLIDTASPGSGAGLRDASSVPELASGGGLEIVGEVDS